MSELTAGLRLSMGSFFSLFEDTKEFSKDGDGLKQALYTWLVKDGYLYDYVVAAVVLIINSTVPLVRVKPLQRYLIPNDPDLSYPIVQETISGEQLTILMLVIPIGTFFVALLVYRRLFDFHHAMLTMLEGFALVLGWKRWMNLVGRYRPMYFAMVADGTAESDGGNQSYPSGHAAYMFYGMTITTLYLLGKFKVFVKPFPGTFLIAFLCLTPIMLATVVAVSRPADHEHHFSDINAGMFVGLSLAMFCYLLNYPSLFDPDAGEPKLRSFQRRSSILAKQELSHIKASEGYRAELERGHASVCAGAAAAGGDAAPMASSNGLHAPFQRESHNYQP